MPDHYQILGVPPNAETAEIATAYRQLSRRGDGRHPDRGGDAERYQALQNAHDILIDPEKRRKYDISIGQQPQAFGVQQLVDDGSTYGRILKLLERVQPSTTFHLRIPTIVVIGDESNGKSSLMERLTMREYFETGHGFCTKVAVRMRLRKVVKGHPRYGFVNVRRIKTNEAGDRVKRSNTEYAPEDLADGRILDKIKQVYENEGLNGEDRVLADEEVEIKVWGADVPNLDLVDLPGIVQSASLHAETLSITKHYLRQPHTLVVCVIDGSNDSAVRTSAALRECAALADRTVVAVTKFDRLPSTPGTPLPPEIRERFREIWNVLCNQMPAIDQSRIIPVINRDSSPKPTLHVAIQEDLPVKTPRGSSN